MSRAISGPYWAGVVGLIAFTMPATIDAQHPVTCFQERIDQARAFHPCDVHGVAVHHDYRLAGALLGVVDLHAARVEEFALMRRRRLSKRDDGP